MPSAAALVRVRQPPIILEPTTRETGSLAICRGDVIGCKINASKRIPLQDTVLIHSIVAGVLDPFECPRLVRVGFAEDTDIGDLVLDDFFGSFIPACKIVTIKLVSCL